MMALEKSAELVDPKMSPRIGEPVTREELDEREKFFGPARLGRVKKAGLALLAAASAGGVLGWLARPKAEEGASVTFQPAVAQKVVEMAPSQGNVTIPGTTIPTELTPTPTSQAIGGEQPGKGIGPESTPTPIPTETRPEAKIWKIEVDETVKDNISPISKRTLEEDMQIFTEILQKFPVLADTKVIIVPGRTSEFRQAEKEIRFARDYSSKDLMVLGAIHEIVHALDPDLNLAVLSKTLSPAELSKLIELKKNLIADEVWGADYPSVSKIFEGKQSVSRDLTKVQPEQNWARYSSTYPDAIWVHGMVPGQEEPNHTFEPLYQAQWDRLKVLAVQSRGESRYDNIAAFIKGNQAEIEAMSKENPLFAFAIEKILEDGEYFQLKNMLWLYGSSVRGELGGKYTESWWKAMSTYINLELKEAYLDGTLEKQFDIPQRDKLRIEDELKQLKYIADYEKWAEAGSIALFMQIEEHPIQALIPTLGR